MSAASVEVDALDRPVLFFMVVLNPGPEWWVGGRLRSIPMAGLRTQNRLTALAVEKQRRPVPRRNS